MIAHDFQLLLSYLSDLGRINRKLNGMAGFGR